MSDTQILVLTVTFLVAAAIVLPLIFLAYRKEQRRVELEEKRVREAEERARRRQQAEEEERKRENTTRIAKQTVATFESLKQRFKEIRETTYTSPACSACASHLVHIEDMGPDTGVLTCRCTKCGTQRRVYALSKETFLRVSPELDGIMKAYRAVMNFYPDYAGLAVSFPEPVRRTD